MHAIWISSQIDETAQINSRLPVGSQSHYFPLVTVPLEPQKCGKLTEEISNRIRKWNGGYMLQPSIMSVPDGSSFPSAATIHDHYGRIRKAGVAISADGMCQVMIDVTRWRFCIAKLIREAFCAALLVPHADEMRSGFQNVQIIQGHLPERKTFQVVAICGSGMGPTEARLVQLGGLHACKIETCLNRVTRETCVMFQATDALFRDSK